MSKIKTKYDWQPAKELSELLECDKSVIYAADRTGELCKGQRIESRRATREDDPDNPPTRLADRPNQWIADAQESHLFCDDNMADLLADLAGCEARIEELEAEIEKLQEQIDHADFGQLKTVYDALESYGVTVAPDGLVAAIAHLASERDTAAGKQARTRTRELALADRHGALENERNDLLKQLKKDDALLRRVMAVTSTTEPDQAVEWLERTAAETVAKSSRPTAELIAAAWEIAAAHNAEYDDWLPLARRLTEALREHYDGVTA